MSSQKKLNFISSTKILKYSISVNNSKKKLKMKKEEKSKHFM